MNRLLIGGFIGALLGGGLGVLIAADEGQGSIFIRVISLSLRVRFGKSCSHRDG